MHLKCATFTEVPIEEGSDLLKVVAHVPVKYKHCHGDTDNMRRAAKMQNFFRRHFVDILNKPRKSSKLQVVAEKIKSLFKFGSKNK